MRISIVTISFNQARFLRECMDSVLSQDYDDVEYIVVDPGSVDGSRAIIEECGGRVAHIFEPDAGPADGLNKGFALATGDVFGFVNADDLLLPGALKRVAGAFARNPDADVITGCGYYIDADGRRQRRLVSSKFTPWLYAHGAATVFQQGTFFRRSSFQSVNGFNSENRIAWDGELFLDMSLKGECFARISDDLASFRLHGSSITGSGGQSSANDAFRSYRERVFLKVTGHNRRKLDYTFDVVARVVKYVSDPAYVFARIKAAVDLQRRTKREGKAMRQPQ